MPPLEVRFSRIGLSRPASGMLERALIGLTRSQSNLEADVSNRAFCCLKVLEVVFFHISDGLW